MESSFIGYEAIEHDSPSTPVVIALDPGGTTGWAVMSVVAEALAPSGDDDYSILDNVVHWDQGQIEGDHVEQCDAILDLMIAWDNATIVCEDFKLRTTAAELSPVEIQKNVLWFAQRLFDPPRPLMLQMPALAMTTATNDRLKRWKLYRRDGQEHARDATRHAISFMRRAKERPRLRHSAWASIYGPNGELLHGD